MPRLRRCARLCVAATFGWFAYDLRTRTKLLLALSLIIVLQTAVGVSIYVIARNRIYEMERQNLRQGVWQFGQAVDHYLDIYRHRVRSIARNPEFRSLLAHHYATAYEEFVAEARISDILLDITEPVLSTDLRPGYQMGRLPKAVVYRRDPLFFGAAGVVLDWDAVSQADWARDLMRAAELHTWSTASDSVGLFLVLSYRVLDYSPPRDLAVIRVYLPAERVENLIEENLRLETEAFALLAEGTRPVAVVGSLAESEQNRRMLESHLSSHGSREYVRTVIGGSSFHAGSIDSAVPGWSFVYLVDQRVLRSRLHSIAIVTVLALILTAAISILLAVGIASIVETRVGVLVRKTSLINQRRTTTFVRLRGTDEFGVLDQNFNAMLDRINSLIAREQKTNRLLAAARLTTIQEHINPHLLNNALSTIRGLARTSGHGRVASLADDLMRFYRNIITETELWHQFSTELEIVEAYVGVARKVYDVRIEYSCDIPTELPRLYCPRMLLQPLVENSILHGLRPIGSGDLLISGQIASGTVEIAVSDTGVGMSDAELARVQRSGPVSSSTVPAFGLRSVIERLRILYPGAARVDIESTVNTGTSILISMPVVTQADLDDFLVTSPFRS